MSLAKKSELVLKLFEELDEQTSIFAADSGFKCKPGCGECCVYPKIHATILEFIPFAYKMYLEGKATGLLETLKNRDAEFSSCLIFNPIRLNSSNGSCSSYSSRGLICRLFGYSGNLNKDGAYNIITCGIIKTENPAFFNSAESIRAGSKNLPVASEYYSKLQTIDLSLAMETYPVNVAIRKALEYTLAYYAYRTSSE
jgi:uncharacterized protein